VSCGEVSRPKGFKNFLKKRGPENLKKKAACTVAEKALAGPKERPPLSLVQLKRERCKETYAYARSLKHPVPSGSKSRAPSWHPKKKSKYSGAGGRGPEGGRGFGGGRDSPVRECAEPVKSALECFESF
jgi:hypothetical protein